MDVINLGNFGARRPSVLHGVPGAIQEGLRTGSEQGKNIAEVKNMEAQRAYQQQELKIKHAALSRQIEKDDFEKEIKQAEHGLVVADNLASKLDSMDPQMKAVTLASPSIKAVTDGLKKTNPELFDDTGNFVGRSTKERIETQINQHRQQSIATVEALVEKSKAEGGLGPEDMKALNGALLTSKIYHNSNMKDLTNFIEKAHIEKAGPEATKKGFMQLPFMQKIMSGFQKPAMANDAGENSDYSPALASPPPMQQQAGVPQQGGGTSNASDPLSIGV